MNNNVLRNRIAQKLDQIKDCPNSIIVLKGIPLRDVGCNATIDVEKIISNKLGYFFGVVNSRKFITYEEYLLLNSFLLEQYETIYILTNNVYINQFPIDVKYSEETKQGLLNHFTESEDDNDESVIANSEILDIYNGVEEFNNYLIAAYCEEKAIDSVKIRKINLFDYVPQEIRVIEKPRDLPIIEINDESDYIRLVKYVFNEPEIVYVRTNNFVGDLNRLHDHISILKYYWMDYLDLYLVKSEKVESSFEHREEYTQLLKQYWGYDSFRNIDIYDLNALESGEKKVTQISQEQVISDLVQQAENSAKDNVSYKDVFVTAPTGAGKSVMFQIPAIYLAEKYNLLTIVISPLIGLMNDQVNSLEQKNYKGAKTINSNISPILKEEILQNVADGTYDILYISPETLLARSDVEQLIGDRTIGMIVIDEAHIVTTWGKQFRPDYWYLGDHISKLRKRQRDRKERSFVIATFTATAIFGGPEDMYLETKNSLHMIGPITYLGYMKRKDIEIDIDTSKKPSGERKEYQTDKFNDICMIAKRAVITGKKTLVYFPTVTLIEECYRYLEHDPVSTHITKYYGPLDKNEKDYNYHMFLEGQKLVMLATKAFGMGIDINDIQLIVHFAPTGNVCDYVQEIGRAARREDLVGDAYYHYNSKDFKFINRLHGLSTVRPYQLIEVAKKIDELYSYALKTGEGRSVKSKNAMLLDAENFSYVFDTPISDADDNINKVKTSLLIIQKDFESKIGYSPITVRPVPMFAIGYFQIEPEVQKSLLRMFGKCVEEVNETLHICKVNLSIIWSKRYKSESFPQFKYKLYSKDKEFDFNQHYPIKQAYIVNIEFTDDYNSRFKNIMDAVKQLAHNSVISQKYIYDFDIINELCKSCGIKKYKAEAICDVLLASMMIYRRKYGKGVPSIYNKRETENRKTSYLFETSIDTYFRWVEKVFSKIVRNTSNGKLYLIDDIGQNIGETNTVLGILEAMNVLSFEMNGGANSQLYIYVNQIRPIKNMIQNPSSYHNGILEKVAIRHLIATKMLTYIYEGNFGSDKTWDILEDYFLGIIPERVKAACKKENPAISFE